MQRCVQFAQVALMLLLSTSGAYGSPLMRRATVCNGQASLCSRLYSNVTFVGAHDSYAVSVTDNVFTNQDQNITQQLNDGIRMLQSQVHNKNGVLELCHSTCSVQDSGPLVDYLKTVKSWLDANPNEVLTLLIVNIDNQPPSSYDSVFKTAGLDSVSYTPNGATTASSDWPTLGSMIDSGKRLVTFMDSNADFSAVPYIIQEFGNIWETAFDVTDTSFNCSVSRSQGDTSTQMGLINHFLDRIVLGSPAPDRAHANTTNAVSGVGSLGQQVQTCGALNGRYPTFMLVDFYEYGGGSVFQVAANANGVSYNPSTPVASPATSTNTAGNSGVTSRPIGAAHATTSLHWSTLALAIGSVALGAWTL